MIFVPMKVRCALTCPRCKRLNLMLGLMSSTIWQNNPVSIVQCTSNLNQSKILPPTEFEEIFNIMGVRPDPFILSSIPYFLQTICLRLAALYVESMRLWNVRTGSALLEYTSDSIQKLQKSINSILLHMKKLFSRVSQELCCDLFVAWKKLVDRYKSRDKRAAQLVLQFLLRVFSEWRIVITGQQDLSLSALIITDQVLLIQRRSISCGFSFLCSQIAQLNIWSSHSGSTNLERAALKRQRQVTNRCPQKAF